MTSDRVYIGSPESIGVAENHAAQEGLISLLGGLERGNYLVSLYLSKSSCIIVLKKVDDNYVFPITTKFPRLD